MEKGQSILKDLLSRKQNNNHAKNVIMFLGDGLSFPTVAATRVYAGGEEMDLSFEKFPHAGFSKVFQIKSRVIRLSFTLFTSYHSDVLCRRPSSRFSMYFNCLSLWSENELRSSRIKR